MKNGDPKLYTPKMCIWKDGAIVYFDSAGMIFDISYWNNGKFFVR